MERIACPCYMNAKSICISHGIYLCSNCALSHECETVDLQTFIKDVNHKQVRLLDLFKILGFDTPRNKANAAKAVADKIEVLKQHKNSINEKLDEMISVCNMKLIELLNKQVQPGYEPTVIKLNDLKKSKKHIKLEKELNSINFAKMKNEEKDRVALFIGRLKDEKLTNELNEFLLTLERQIDRVKNVLEPLELNTLQDVDEAVKQCHKGFTAAIYRELTFFQLPNAMDLKFPENNLEETIVINKHRWNKTNEFGPPSPKRQPVFRRDSDNLIADSTFSIKHISMKRNLYQKNSSNDRIPKTNKKSGFANNEISLSDSSSNQESDEEEEIGGGLLKLHNLDGVSINTNSFENSEDEFEDFLDDEDEENENDANHHKEFMQSKCQFTRLLKNTMDEIGEENFFDTKKKAEVTDFIRRFSDSTENVTKKLLLNFNKL